MTTSIVSNEGYHGTDGYDAGFEVTITGSYPYGVEFSATTDVVKRICETQEALWRATSMTADRLVLHDDTLAHLGGENDREHFSLYRADELGMFHKLGFGWVWHEVEASDCRVVYESNGRTSVDAIIRDYAQRMEHIYETRTAGDHTWTGVIGAMLMEMKDRGVQL